MEPEFMCDALDDLAEFEEDLAQAEVSRLWDELQERVANQHAASFAQFVELFGKINRADLPNPSDLSRGYIVDRDSASAKKARHLRKLEGC